MTFNDLLKNKGEVINGVTKIGTFFMDKQ